MKNRNTQWHPAFCSAIKLELRENKKDLSYISEYNINSGPIQIDLLVVEKSPDICIQNEIGRLFRGHNIMEYKSPDDSLNEDVFVKVIGYACLYKANEAHLDDIRLDDITLSFVREGYPRNLIQWLQSNDFEVNEVVPGIFYVVKPGFFPTQIIVGNKLNKKAHAWLTALTSNMDEESVKRLVVHINALSEKDDRDNADSVFQVSATENAELFNLIKEVDSDMCEALRELMRPEIEEELKKGREQGREQGRAEGREEGREEGRVEGREEGRAEGRLLLLYDLVNDNLITMEDAAKKASMSKEEFAKAKRKAGK